MSNDKFCDLCKDKKSKEMVKCDIPGCDEHVLKYIRWKDKIRYCDTSVRCDRHKYEMNIRSSTKLIITSSSP
jgi:hypothetical protein